MDILWQISCPKNTEGMGSLIQHCADFSETAVRRSSPGAQCESAYSQARDHSKSVFSSLHIVLDHLDVGIRILHEEFMIMPILWAR